jgi:hypothetical protein
VPRPPFMLCFEGRQPLRACPGHLEEFRASREVLSIHTRCALVSAALRVSMYPHVFPVDRVVQGIEAEATPSDRVRSIRLLSEHKRQFAQPPLCPMYYANMACTYS